MAQEWWSGSEVVEPSQAARQGVIIPKEPDKPREAPSGYRWVNGNLEAIPGGPADPNASKPTDAKPTEAQQKTLTLLTRIAGGTSDIQKTLAIDPEAQQAGLMETLSRNVLGEGVVTRSIAGPERRMVTDAQADILDALLTLGTGAAYSREQLIGQTISYFPQYGDTPAEIAAKNDRLQRLTEAARIAAGPLAEKFDETIKPLFGTIPTPPPAATETTGPAVTVSPEESIATFGQLTYDAQGNLVGRAYQQTGGTIYDAQGNELGLTGAVTEEQLQQPAPSFLGGIVSDIGEAITGSERATPMTEALPDWTNMPEMQQLFSLPAFQASLGTMFGGGPQEIAQIVQSNFPGTQVFQDEKGNYILQSPSTGQRYAIKPGFQVSDIPRAIGTVLAGGGIQGGVRGAMAVGAREAGLQTGIEALQAGTGGTFNPEDIAMAGVGGGVLQKAGEVLPAAAGRVVGTMRRGTAPAPVIPQGAPELPGGIIRPGGGVTPPPAPMTAAAPSVAPVAPTGAVDDVTVAPRMFEAGEAVTSRAGGAMGTSPETIRVQRAEDLPVPVNLAKFQRTRAFEDMQRARELAKNNEVGGPIRERLAQQQQQIAANFDSFLERTGSEIWGNLEDQGVAVSDALRKMAARDKTRINALYKKAKNSEEAQAEVPLAEAVEINVDGEPYVGSVIDYLNSQPTGVPSSAVSDTARQFAVNLGIATRGPNGQLIAANPTVGNLESFRREMSGIAGDATGRRQEKIIKDLVDAHTEPYAGNLYQEARAARRNYAERYENMSLISNLIGTKKNSPESVIAAEKVVDRILSASTDLQNLRQLRDILQSDKAGQQAWREIQGSVIESLRGKAYPNGAVRDEAGNQVISPAAFAKEVGRLDKAGKLDVIFDNKTANHLRTLADVTQDVFTAPPGSVNFSNSSSGWLNAADAVFNTIVAQIPLPDGAFSRILGPASKYIFKAKERKALKKEVRELLD